MSDFLICVLAISHIIIALVFVTLVMDIINWLFPRRCNKCKQTLDELEVSLRYKTCRNCYQDGNTN